MRVTGPLFKWFGSKWLSSKTLPVPLHETIIEPFAGSAGYSLRYASRKVIIAEKDPYIYALWKWLIQTGVRNGEQFIRDIPVNISVGTDIRNLGLGYGQQLLLKSWQRTNNVGSCWTISPWGNSPGQWTANTRARVAEEVQAIKHWQVYQDASELFDLKQEATWFIDPPYEYNYKYKSLVLDYTTLGERITRLNGQKIVCEAVCPKTGKVPEWLDFKPFGERITSRRKPGNNHHSKELICVMY